MNSGAMCVCVRKENFCGGLNILNVDRKSRSASTPLLTLRCEDLNGRNRQDLRNCQGKVKLIFIPLGCGTRYNFNIIVCLL